MGDGSGEIEDVPAPSLPRCNSDARRRVGPRNATRKLTLLETKAAVTGRRYSNGQVNREIWYYKEPDGDVSRLIEGVVGPEVVGFDAAPEDLRFAAAVAAFGMRLRGSENAGDLGWDDVQRIARGAMERTPGAIGRNFLRWWRRLSGYLGRSEYGSHAETQGRREYWKKRIQDFLTPFCELCVLLFKNAPRRVPFSAG